MHFSVDHFYTRRVTTMFPGHAYFAKGTSDITGLVAPPIAAAAGFRGSGVFARVGLKRRGPNP